MDIFPVSPNEAVFTHVISIANNMLAEKIEETDICIRRMRDFVQKKGCVTDFERYLLKGFARIARRKLHGQNGLDAVLSKLEALRGYPEYQIKFKYFDLSKFVKDSMHLL
jgi:hypothetical protein